MKRTISCFAIVGVVLLAAGCSRQENKPESAKPVAVKTAKVQEENVRTELAIGARVQPDPARVVRVFPPAGGRLIRVAVHPGDRVTKGQTVAVLSSSDISQARADYEKARTEEQKSQHSLERTKLLFEHKVASEREYQEAQAEHTEASAELQRAEARLRLLGGSPQSNANEVALTSPIAGSVLDIGAASGELSKSTDNANPICTVADLSSVWVVGDVYEKDLSAIGVGQTVQIRINAYPDRTWEGKISSISDQIDPQTRTLKMRVVLNNAKHELKPEMFASIRVTRPEQKALVIPAGAVLHEGGDTAVMVKVGDDKFERRLIATQPLTADTVIVSNGLKAGEVVAIENAALLRDEARQ